MRLKLILLGLAAVIILGRWSYINTKGIDRIVYNNDTCDTYFSGDTLIIYTSTQTIMKIHGDSLSKLIFNEDTITPARIACIDANCDSAYLIFNGGEDSIKIGGHVSGAGYTQDTIFTYDTIGVNDSLRVGDTWFTDDDLVPISGDNLVKGVGAAGKLAVWIDDDSIAYSSNLDNSNVYIDNASNTGLGYNVPNVGVGNSAFGDRSLTSTISGGNYNTGIGTFSLHSNTTGDYNIGLGPNAGYYNTTLSNRFFVNPYSSRGSLLNDSTMSLLYGVAAAIAANQRLWVNGDLYAPYEFIVRDTTLLEFVEEHSIGSGAINDSTLDLSSANGSTFDVDLDDNSTISAYFKDDDTHYSQISGGSTHMKLFSSVGGSYASDVTISPSEARLQSLTVGADAYARITAGQYYNQFLVRKGGVNRMIIWEDTTKVAIIYNEGSSDSLFRVNPNDLKIFKDLEITGSTDLSARSTGTISDNDATPDVTGAEVWTYTGSANSVTVTDLDNPTVGKIYRIIGNSDTYTISINDAGNFNLAGNWTGGIDDVITIYVQADNDYIELSRSDN